MQRHNWGYRAVILAAAVATTALPVSADPIGFPTSSSTLPPGAATAANQATEITALGTINTTLGTPFQAGGAIAALPAGSALIGSTSTAGRVEVTATVQNASYVSGNSLGGLISFTLPRTATGILQSVSVQFVGGATTQVNEFCFDANPTGSTFTDKSTFTIAAADEAKRINKTGFALTPAAVTGDAVTGAAVDNYAKPFSSTGTIYCAVVSTGTFTPATTTDMRVSIAFVQNAL